MSLSRPHPVWTLPENCYEVAKATIVAMMLSGRYNSDYHVRHWSRTNPTGYCQLCLASRYNDHDLNDDISLPPPLGTLEHILLECMSLNEARNKCISLWLDYTSDKFLLRDLFMIDGSCKPTTQFLLDPSSCSDVIRIAQENNHGIQNHLFYLTRTWCHSIHIRRLKLLKLFNIIWLCSLNSSALLWNEDDRISYPLVLLTLNTAGSLAWTDKCYFHYRTNLNYVKLIEFIL